MNEPLTIGAALVAGLVGSGHCLGMCGPLAALAGLRREGRGAAAVSALTHNLGRLLSYALLGALVGALGMAAGSLAPVAAAGPALRIALGVVLVLLGVQLVAPGFRLNPLDLVGRKLGVPLWRRLQPLTLRLNQRKGVAANLARGMLWGWLPCGLVYSLLALAAVSGTAGSGALVMVAFGVGTLPAMLGVGLLGSPFAGLSKARLKPLMGAMMIASGFAVSAMPVMHLSGAHDHSHHAQHAPQSDEAGEEAAHHHHHQH